jgi:hypothetical protein
MQQFLTRKSAYEFASLVASSRDSQTLSPIKRDVSDRNSRPSCSGSPVFLLLDPHHDLERIIGQGPLQRLRLIPLSAHPYVALLVGRQDYRHRFRMDWRDHRVGRRCQEAIDLMRSGDRLRLRATVAIERGPDASKREQGPVLIEREPDDILLLGLRVRIWSVLGEAVCRN